MSPLRYQREGQNIRRDYTLISQQSKNAKIFLAALFMSLAKGIIAGLCARLAVFPIISLLHILFSISADTAYFWIGKIAGDLTFIVVMYKYLRNHNWSQFCQHFVNNNIHNMSIYTGTYYL